MGLSDADVRAITSTHLSRSYNV